MNNAQFAKSMLAMYRILRSMPTYRSTARKTVLQTIEVHGMRKGRGYYRINPTV